MPRPLNLQIEDWSILTPDHEESELDYKYLDQIEVFDIVAQREVDDTRWDVDEPLYGVFRKQHGGKA